MVRLAGILILVLLVACESEDGGTVGFLSTAVTSENLVISPTSWNFGSFAAGDSGTKTFTLTNPKSNTRQIRNLAPGTPALSSPFSYLGGSYPGTGGTCGSTISNNASCTVVLSFQPLTTGSFSGTLALQFQLGNQSTIYTNTVALSGTGTQTPPSLSFSEGSSYNFQERAVGSSTSKTFTLSNSGQSTTTTLTISQASTPFGFLGGLYPGTGGTCTTTLLGNSSCTVVLSFSPSGSGSFSSSFQISASNASAQASLSLTGSGIVTQTGGTTDTSFGSSGIAVTDTGATSEILTSLQVFSSEKLFAGGFAYTGTSNDFVASVQNLSGAADASFNGTGTLTLDLGGNSNDVVQSANGLSNGKILLAGYSDNHFAAVRLNANGSLDTSFNGTGKQILNWGGDSFAYQAALDASEDPILVGTTNVNGTYQMAVAKLNSSGALDTNFNGNGRRFLSVGAYNSMAFAAAVQSDGKILVAGFGRENTTNDLAIVRFNANGTLDTTFSGDGIQLVDHGGDEKATSLIVQSDGKIVVGGRTIQSGSEYFAINLTRLNSDGSLDTSFATGGKFRAGFLLSESANATVVRASSGEYYLAWTRYRKSNPAQNTVKVSKFNSSGQLITSFGSSGTLNLTSILSRQDQNPAITILNDGRVVVGGTTVDNSNIAATRIW